MITEKVNVFLKYRDIDFFARQPAAVKAELSTAEWYQIDSILQDLQLIRLQSASEAYKASSMAKHKALATEDALALLHQHALLG